MTTRFLTPVLLAGLGALVAGCPEPPTSEERLCQRYCYGQLQAIPTLGADSCASSDAYYWDECVRTCARDIDAIHPVCRPQLVRAYGCGSDHGWFCVPREGGGHTLTQFDTCRDTWNAVSACEQATSDAGTP